MLCSSRAHSYIPLSVASLREQTFNSYNQLIDTIGDQLMLLNGSASTSDTEWLEAILSSHPRLGEQRVTTLSAASKAEQAQLQHGDLTEAAQLKDLNEDYEKTFPGLRYVYVARISSEGP